MEMEDILSWEKICENAISSGYGDAPLKAKDTARAAARELMMGLGHPDSDSAEIPEDCIGEFCGKMEVLFDSRGNIASFRLPTWIEDKVYDAKQDYYLEQDLQYTAVGIADSRGCDCSCLELSSGELQAMVDFYRKYEDSSTSHNAMLENAVMAVLGERFEQMSQTPYGIGEIAARYQSRHEMQDDYVMNIAIIYESDGFHNHFLYDEYNGKGAAGTGAFATLEEAKQDVMAHNPDAWEVDSFQEQDEQETADAVNTFHSRRAR